MLEELTKQYNDALLRIAELEKTVKELTKETQPFTSKISPNLIHYISSDTDAVRVCLSRDLYMYREADPYQVEIFFNYGKPAAYAFLTDRVLHPDIDAVMWYGKIHG